MTDLVFGFDPEAPEPVEVYVIRDLITKKLWRTVMKKKVWTRQKDAKNAWNNANSYQSVPNIDKDHRTGNFDHDAAGKYACEKFGELVIGGKTDVPQEKAA